MSNTAAPPAVEPRVGRLIAMAAVVGIVASLAGVLFMAAVHGLERVVWTTIPQAAGWAGTPWWWVGAMLVTGAVLTWAACRLPGGGGHHPLDEFAFNIEGVAVVSVVLAALATLAFGAVVGPEAPLVAVGTATAGLLFRGGHPGERQIMLAAGGVAAMGLILGNPLNTAILVLEGAVVKGSPGGRAATSTLLPAMVALGFGYLIQVGVGDWAGFGETILAVPGLPGLPGTNLSALVACGIAAGAGGALRLPFTSALLAVLLCAGAGLAVTTSAIVGAVVGILVRVAADRVADPNGPAADDSPAAAAAGA